MRSRLDLVAAGCLVVLVVAVVAGPLALDGGGTAGAVDFTARLAGASVAHPLGTDELGRDVLVRLLEAGRVSLLVGILGAALATAIGAAIGFAAGEMGGAVDALLMRGTDLVMSLPLLPFMVLVAAARPERLLPVPAVLGDAGPASLRLIVLIGAFAWPFVARLVRAQTLALRQEQFVQAARALGSGQWWVVTRHLLPATAPLVLVTAALMAGKAILAEAVLSFLGLGIQPPVASWGNMLSNAQEMVWEAPRLALLPGFCILLTVACLNRVADRWGER